MDIQFLSLYRDEINKSFETKIDYDSLDYVELTYGVSKAFELVCENERYKPLLKFRDGIENISEHDDFMYLLSNLLGIHGLVERFSDGRGYKRVYGKKVYRVKKYLSYKVLERIVENTIWYHKNIPLLVSREELTAKGLFTVLLMFQVFEIAGIKAKLPVIMSDILGHRVTDTENLEYSLHHAVVEKAIKYGLVKGCLKE